MPLFVRVGNYQINANQVTYAEVGDESIDFYFVGGESLTAAFDSEAEASAAFERWRAILGGLTLSPGKP